MSEISKITIDGVEYSMKDAVAREALESKADKSDVDAVNEELKSKADTAYVDEKFDSAGKIVEGTFTDGVFYGFVGDDFVEIPPKSGVLYLDVLTNKLYFWNDGQYVEVTNQNGSSDTPDTPGTPTIDECIPKVSTVNDLYQFVPDLNYRAPYDHEYTSVFRAMSTMFGGNADIETDYDEETAPPTDEALCIMKTIMSAADKTITQNVTVYRGSKISQYTRTGVWAELDNVYTWDIDHWSEFEKISDVNIQTLDNDIAELKANMGDVETALDSIIAIQNELIGGESI